MNEKIFVEKLGYKIPVAQLESISSKMQLVLGDYNNDLVLRTSGKISVQVGNKFYNIAFDENKKLINTNTIVEDITDIDVSLYENGTIIYSKIDETPYILIDGTPTSLLGATDGTIVDPNSFNDLSGESRKEIQKGLGLYLNSFDELQSYKQSDYFNNQLLYVATEKQHFILNPNSDPYIKTNWRSLYLSNFTGGRIDSPLGIQTEPDIRYSLTTLNSILSNKGFITNEGIESVGYKKNSTLSEGFGITKDYFNRWTVESDSYILKHKFSTPTFLDGFSGFGIMLDATTGSLTVDNLTVRKQMNVYELVVNQIRATNGSLWVTDAIKADFVEVLGNDYKIYIDTESNSIYQPFRVNDIIRCQKWNGSNVKYYSTIVKEISTNGEWFLLNGSDTVYEGDGAPSKGDDIVRVGNLTDTNRQGAIYLTSSDQDAPYMDIIDGVTTTNFYNNLKARLGKLDGITDDDFGELSGYGIYTSQGYFKGDFHVRAGGNSNVPTDEELTAALDIIAGQISLKVDQTVYDANNIIVDNKFASIELTVDGITSTVSSLNTRIGAAESTITQLADEIELKVDVDGIISAINLSSEGILIQADRIDLTGIVTVTTVKSSPTGQRIEINPETNSMSFFNSDNFLQVIVTASVDSGNVNGTPLGGIRMYSAESSSTSFGSANGFFSNGSGLRFIAPSSGILSNASIVGITSQRNEDNSGISAGLVGVDQNAARDYNNTTTYRKGDIIVNAGTAYIYINDTNTAGNTPPNSTYWQIVSGASNSYGVVCSGDLLVTGAIYTNFARTSKGFTGYRATTGTFYDKWVNGFYMGEAAGSSW